MDQLQFSSSRVGKTRGSWGGGNNNFTAVGITVTQTQNHSDIG